MKIGAKDENLSSTLEKIGSNLKRTSDDLKKLGSTPIGQAAQASLVDLEKTIKGVTDGQQRLADRGRLAAQGLTAMGGPAKLTRTELEAINRTLQSGLDAFRALGQEAPKDLQKVAAAAQQQLKALDGLKGGFGSLSGVAGLATKALGAFGIGIGVSAVVGFGKALFEDADALVKMHDKTGISVEGLQKFRIAGDDAGNTLDQLTIATNQMQNRLAGGDKSAVAALEKIGLSLAALKSQAPDQQFMTIAAAIRAIQNPAEQVNVAMDIFGRQGAEILPTIKRGFDDLKDSAGGMSAEAVKALDDTGDAIDRLWRRTKSTIGEVVGQSILALEQNRDRNLRALKGGQLGPGETPIQVLSGVEKTQLGNRPFEPQVIAPPGFPADLDAVNAKLKREQDELDAARAAADRAAEAHKRFAASVHGTTLALNGFLAIPGGRSGTGQLGPDILNLTSTPFKTGVNSIVPGQFAKSMTDELRPQLTSSFGALFQTAIPQALVASFQGGGSPVKAVGSLLGAQIGTNLVTKVGGSITSLLGKTVGGAVNAILPGVGALIGPGISALIGGIKKLFGGPSATELKGRTESADFQALIEKSLTAQQRAAAGGEKWKATLIGVRDAYIATGRTAAEAERITAMLFDTKNPEAYKRAIEEIQGVFDEQKQDTQDLQAAVQKYAFTIDELGPAMRKQQLDEQAHTLLNDWRLLVGSGIAVATVNAHMADAMNAYLQVAKRTGTEVPSALKPILQSLIDQGLLVDADGNKIEDLGKTGVTFSETMSQGFDRIVDRLNILLRGLGLIPAALDAIPTDRTINIGVHYDDPGFLLPNELRRPFANTASTGGLVTAAGIQHFAGGGRVLPFLRHGSDTVPAMLTPGEVVLNKQQQQEWNGSGSRPIYQVNVQIDRRTIATAMIDNIEFDEGGIRRQIKRVAS